MQLWELVKPSVWSCCFCTETEVSRKERWMWRRGEQGKLKYPKISWNPPRINWTHTGLSLLPRLQLAQCKCPIVETGTLNHGATHAPHPGVMQKHDPAGSGVEASTAAAHMLTRNTCRYVTTLVSQNSHWCSHIDLPAFKEWPLLHFCFPNLKQSSSWGLKFRTPGKWSLTNVIATKLNWFNANSIQNQEKQFLLLFSHVLSTGFPCPVDFHWRVILNTSLSHIIYIQSVVHSF